MVTRRRGVVLAVVGAAAVGVVGISAAATMIPRDDPAPAPGSRGRVDTGVVSRPTRQEKSPEELSRHWTEERMRQAKPMTKKRPGGQASVAPAPAPTGTGVQTVPTSKPTTKTSSPDAAPVARGQDTGTDAGDGWTQDEMDSAKPMEKTVPGSSEGSDGTPDPSGGGVVVGTP